MHCSRPYENHNSYTTSGDITDIEVPANSRLHSRRLHQIRGSIFEHRGLKLTAAASELIAEMPIDENAAMRKRRWLSSTGNVSDP